MSLLQYCLSSPFEQKMQGKMPSAAQPAHLKESCVVHFEHEPCDICDVFFTLLTLLQILTVLFSVVRIFHLSFSKIPQRTLCVKKATFSGKPRRNEVNLQATVVIISPSRFDSHFLPLSLGSTWFLTSLGSFGSAKSQPAPFADTKQKTQELQSAGCAGPVFASKAAYRLPLLDTGQEAI